MPIKNLIITGANTAKEENHINKPFLHEYGDRQAWAFDFERWERAEQSLKEYRITLVKITENNIQSCEHDHVKSVIKTMIGSKVQCEVNEETLEAIIL